MWLSELHTLFQNQNGSEGVDVSAGSDRKPQVSTKFSRCCLRVILAIAIVASMQISLQLLGTFLGLPLLIYLKVELGSSDSDHIFRYLLQSRSPKSSFIKVWFFIASMATLVARKTPAFRLTKLISSLLGSRLFAKPSIIICYSKFTLYISPSLL